MTSFEYIGQVADVPMVLLGKKDLPANNFKELEAYIKANGSKVTMANAGPGAVSQLCGLLFQSRMGVRLTNIPYKGTGQSVPAVIAGQVDCVLAAMPSLAGFVASDRVRILASASSGVSPLAPNVKPMGQDIKDFDYAFLLGVIGKPGTPQVAIDKLNFEFAEIMKEPDMIQKLALIGVEPIGQGSEVFKKALDKDAESLKNTVKKAGILPK
jgi:tripartite-type tricarboxylate transporter receptor subunit TctC